MPEGDTLFRTARALGRALTGHAITGFRTGYAQLARANDDAPFVGQTVEQVEARGKFLLIHLSGGGILLTHMLMKGAWHLYRPGQRWQKPAQAARVVLETANYLAVAFDVPVAEWHSAASIARDRRIPRPAADLLNQEFDAEAAIARIAACGEEEIGNVLLRQRVMAGVGNEFKSEICFVCAVNPYARVEQLPAEKLAEIVATAQRLLAANVREDSGDGVVTYNGSWRRTTLEADPAKSVWVYGRAGQPCRRCGEPIRLAVQGPEVRLTYWCPGCQPFAGAEDGKRPVEGGGQ